MYINDIHIKGWKIFIVCAIRAKTASRRYNLQPHVASWQVKKHIYQFCRAYTLIPDTLFSDEA